MISIPYIIENHTPLNFQSKSNFEYKIVKNSHLINLTGKKYLTIKLNDIFYIKIVTRDLRIVYHGNERSEIRWKERLKLVELMELLGDMFVKIHKNYIIPISRVTGVLSNLSSVQLRKSYNIDCEPNNRYMFEELTIDDRLKKKLLTQLYHFSKFIQFENEWDEILFLNPIHISCIEIHSTTKLVYLLVPYRGASGEKYILKEKSSKPFEEYIKKFCDFKKYFFRVHKNYAINFLVHSDYLTRNKQWDFLNVYYGIDQSFKIPISTKNKRRREIKSILLSLPNLKIE